VGIDAISCDLSYLLIFKVMVCWLLGAGYWSCWVLVLVKVANLNEFHGSLQEHTIFISLNKAN
jgi:hypothetical protein